MRALVTAEATLLSAWNRKKRELEARTRQQLQEYLNLALADAEQKRALEAARVLPQPQQLHRPISMLHTRGELHDVRHPAALQPIHTAVDSTASIIRHTPPTLCLAMFQLYTSICNDLQNCWHKRRKHNRYRSAECAVTI